MSKSKRFDDARLCRLDGQQPTMREKWIAFHRLWRIAHGHGAVQDMDVGMCFRVLFGGWRAIRLMDTDHTDGLVDRSHIPKFLRKQLLEIKRRQRLYAGHYEWMERDKVVANQCRDKHGIEVTPDEVAEVRRKVINLARARAAEMNVQLPKDDEEVLKILKPREEL